MTDQEEEDLENMEQWEEGMNAALSGHLITDHDYPSGSDEAKAFALGHKQTAKRMFI